MNRLMLSLCAYDLVYLLASVTMFAVPLLYPGVVIHDTFTLSVPFLLPIAQTSMTGTLKILNYKTYKKEDTAKI